MKKNKIKLTKNKKKVIKYINKQQYSIKEALYTLKKISFVKFDESIDVAIRLGKVKDYNVIKGVVNLPNGTGKKNCILAIVDKENEQSSKLAGANYSGLHYIEKIKSGWWDKNINIVISMPKLMSKLSLVGKILGPKGLMPNPSINTVSINPEKTIKEIMLGSVSFKSDRYGIIHLSIGKVSFLHKYLLENFNELIKNITKNISSSSKGNYIHNIYISTTMSIGLLLDIKSFDT